MAGGKGQAGVEYLAVVSLSLAVIAIIWAYASSVNKETSAELDVAHARQAVERIRDAADLVNVQGPPAKLLVQVDVPSSVVNASVNSREVVLNVDSGGAVREVYAVSAANLTGSLPLFPLSSGRHVVVVEAIDAPSGALVSITE